MSLTSQLKDKSSPVRLFFEAHSEPSGMLRCLTRDLQSTKAILPPSFKSTSKVAPSFTGTTTDYIIRYLLQNNRLKFEDSFAYAVTQSRPFAISMANQRIVKPDFFSALFDIGKFFLDGRNAAEETTIYSATALAVLEHYYRSKHLPEIMLMPISEGLDEWIAHLDGATQSHKTAWYCFDAFYQSLGGTDYAQDIAKLVRILLCETTDPAGPFYRAKLINASQTLSNAKLVGGADFDCLIEARGRRVMTDIKTISRPLTIGNLQQLIGYALLHDPVQDGFTFSDIGFYLSRTGSFRHLPLERIIKTCLPKFNTIEDARNTFIDEIKTYNSQHSFLEQIRNSEKSMVVSRPRRPNSSIKSSY